MDNNNMNNENNINNNNMNNDYTALNVVDDWETIADNDNINITLNNMSHSVDTTSNVWNTPNIWSNVSTTTENIMMNSSFSNNTISPIIITHSAPKIKIKVNKNIVIKKKEKPFTHNMKIKYKKMDFKKAFDEKKYLSDIHSYFQQKETKIIKNKQN